METPAEFNLALADLAYLSQDDYVQTLPLNIGYIGAYLKKAVSDAKVELFKDPKKLYDALVNIPGRYACLALSNYDWNFNLNRHFLRLAKEQFPGIITVMGGPNIDAGYDTGIEDFFHDHPHLDFYIIGEGEYRFAALIQSIMQNGMNVDAVWERIPDTIVGYDRKNNRILKGHAADVGCCDCQTLPSPYLTGLMDEFLDNPHLAPIIETTRGCPYSCAFCCRGNSREAKIRKFSRKTVLSELQYISRKTKNPLKALYIADNNFGILKRDLSIAQAIKNIHQQDGSLQNIYMFFDKNLNADTLKVAETLKELTDVSLSKQTLNPEVLEIIGRKNIPDATYDRALTKLNEQGVSTFCELIYGLPGESRESFLDGLEKMSHKELNISVYPLLLLKGTRINAPDFKERYQIKSAFRIMPRYLGSYGDINSVEYEELLISHSKMSLPDYLQVRLIVFFHVLFYEKIFTELIFYLRENHLNLIAFFRFMVDDRLNWPKILADFLANFEHDTRSELIDRQDPKLNFTKEEINSIRERVLDLNTYHLCRLISSPERVDHFKEYLLDALQRFFQVHDTVLATEELAFILDFCFDKVPDYPDIKKIKTTCYPYDLDSWLNQEDDRQLAAFKTGKTEYILELHEKAVSLFAGQIKESPHLALNLYRIRKKFIVSQISPSWAYTYQRTRKS